MNKGIRLVLFDVDDTLVHAEDVSLQAFAGAFQSEFGIADAIRDIEFAGRTNPAIVRDVFARHQIKPTDENFQRFFDSYFVWLEKLLAQCRGGRCMGVTEFLRDLKGLGSVPVLGLLTGNMRRAAELKLSRFQLWESFAMGAFGDDAEDRRELARIAVERGCRILNEVLDGDQILVIGDTPHDIQCGQAIGARVLAVATGATSIDELKSCRPHWAVENLTKISAKDSCA